MQQKVTKSSQASQKHLHDRQSRNLGVSRGKAAFQVQRS